MVAALTVIGTASPEAVARGANTVSWQEAALGLPHAWQVSEGGGVVVAVVDTGVQAAHPALVGHVLPGFDFVHGNTNTSDDNGHGTAVAGIVVATCPACRILPVKVLGSDMTGDWNTIAAGVRWAADHGAQVINLSTGGRRATDTLGAAIAYALSKGVIVVAAAGNDGQNESFYPAMYSGVVSVAGVDQNDARYAWSNFGSWVTTVAPGCASASWLANGYTANFCGTSTAAPFISGIAGLAKAVQPHLTSRAFSTALTVSATALPDPTTAAAGVPDANRVLITLGIPATAPTDLTPPHIHRSVRYRLSAFIGHWQNATSYAIQWQRSRDQARWQVVATGPIYTPPRTDAGYTLRVAVTATNTRGATTATSPVWRPISPRTR